MWSYAGTCHLMKYNLFFFLCFNHHALIIRWKVKKKKKKEFVSEGGQGTLAEHVAKSEWVHTKPCSVCSCSTPRWSHPQISQSCPLCLATSDTVGHGKIHTVREALLFTPWASFFLVLKVETEWIIHEPTPTTFLSDRLGLKSGLCKSTLWTLMTSVGYWRQVTVRFGAKLELPLY